MTNKAKTEAIIEKLSAKAHDITPAFPIKRAFLGLMLFSILYIGFMLHFAFGIRIDVFEKLELTPFIVELATTVLLIATTLALATYYASPRENFKKYQILLTAALFTFVCALVCNTATPTLNFNLVEILHNTHCFALFILFASPTTVLGFLILKKGATTNPEWLGFTILLLSASMAYLGVRITCAGETIDHQAITHLMPVILYTIMGYFIGKKILSW